MLEYKNKMKTPTRIIIISVILILSIAILSFSDLGFANAKQPSPEYTYSWTKAICNETQCQDYQIFCNDGELVRQSPITGAVISIPKDWEDPRNETMRERVCNLN
jgi:hypothetical protein